MSVKRVSGVGCVGFIVIMVICAAIGSIAWPYTINSWLHFVGKPETVVWWQGALLGFCPIIGQLTLPAAFVTWILLMFI